MYLWTCFSFPWLYKLAIVVNVRTDQKITFSFVPLCFIISKIFQLLWKATLLQNYFPTGRLLIAPLLGPEVSAAFFSFWTRKIFSIVINILLYSGYYPKTLGMIQPDKGVDLIAILERSTFYNDYLLVTFFYLWMFCSHTRIWQSTTVQSSNNTHFVP